VACAPQAASAGAIFQLLQSVLGVTIDALDRQIVLSHPAVPEGFDEIRVRNLSVGQASVDFTVRRHGGSVSARPASSAAKASWTSSSAAERAGRSRRRGGWTC
jgi:hypothetical protein